MKVLFISALSTERQNSALHAIQKHNIMNYQVQKYNGLLVKGLSYCPEIELECMSVYSWDARVFRRMALKGGLERADRITYNSLPMLFVPYLQYVYNSMIVFFATALWILRNARRERVVICDIVEVFAQAGAFFACVLLGVKKVALVTDFPWNLIGNNPSNGYLRKALISLWVSLSRSLASKYDGYFLLTQQMSNVINKRNRPFVVVEAICESTEYELEPPVKKHAKRVLLFAGLLEERNGICALANAVTRMDDPDLELRIYGDGPAKDAILRIGKRDARIRYMGVAPNHVVVEEEKRSTLLVNPRFTDQGFTRYSFPSKNVEYMISGTPILTTKLPGIPGEYSQYMYTFDDETVDGMAATLKAVLERDEAELAQKGIAAREYILSRKNYLIQAKRCHQEVLARLSEY
jgi:glycosyltransferase involved in cell wall biosynthesis